MKDWLTIGQLAKKTGLTARALRLYEAKGLLKSHSRGDNDYRFYSNVELNQAIQIKEFRDLGFTLAEIAELLQQDAKLTTANLITSLRRKLKVLKQDDEQFQARILRLEKLIASFNKTHKLSESQRRVVMDELYNQTLGELKSRGVRVTEELEKKLRLEVSEVQKFSIDRVSKQLDIIQSVAKDMGLTLGPGRGHAASSLLLFSKGVNHNYSSKFNLLPNLFYNAKNLHVWVDVSFEKAPEFLSRILKKTTLDELKECRIFIYQAPFLSILEKLESELGKINFDSIDDEDDVVLKSFTADQIQNVFEFDLPEKSVMYVNGNERFQRERAVLVKQLWEGLRTYRVTGVEDIFNLLGLVHPAQGRAEMLAQYLSGQESQSIKALPLEVQKILKPTRGQLVFREDYIRILRLYLDWSEADCNRFSFLPDYKDNKAMIVEYEAKVPSDVRELLSSRLMGLYLKAHVVCMWWFIKRSAILNSLHQEKYLAAIKEWSQSHHSAWSDLGFIDKDHRPLALYF